MNELPDPEFFAYPQHRRLRYLMDAYVNGGQDKNCLWSFMPIHHLPRAQQLDVMSLFSLREGNCRCGGSLGGLVRSEEWRDIYTCLTCEHRFIVIPSDCMIGTIALAEMN